jgi:hypothetical protein
MGELDYVEALDDGTYTCSVVLSVNGPAYHFSSWISREEGKELTKHPYS